jgi:hypothetical protein
MGTKNNPGNFDCYHNAASDEPMFIVLGRDPIGAGLVRAWAAARPALEKRGDDAKIIEALQCANAMDDWCKSVGRQPFSALACLPFDVLADELANVAARRSRRSQHLK